jgi:hypothetical protein
MLDSINCEPYGYIKYKHDDTTNIIIEEVEDVKTNVDIKLEDVEINEVEDVKTNVEYIKTEEIEIQ